MVAGHTKTKIAKRAACHAGVGLLSNGMTMKSTAFGLRVDQYFWFWDAIQLLYESNAKRTFVRIQGPVSSTRTLKIIPSSFNYSAHGNAICSTSSFYSLIFNSAIREGVMTFYFRIDQCQSCRMFKLAGRL